MKVTQWNALNWIAGVSVAAEVSFSLMNNILTPERLRLKPTTVENLMFLKLNRNMSPSPEFCKVKDSSNRDDAIRRLSY